MKRLTLYYDSAEELGRLACFQWFYFASSGGQCRIECVAFPLSITRLKSFGSS